MAKHKKHSSTELTDALEHVLYEIWKYKQSVAYYVQIQEAGGEAALEFRVLHHRVLLEFFYGPPKHEDNVVAWEYIDDWQRTHDPRKVTWLEEYMKRCHTMLAHISVTRSEMGKRRLKVWGGEWEHVEPHLERTISEFLGGLSEAHKMTCLTWINQWSPVCHSGIVLRGLAGLVRAESSLSTGE